MEGVTIGSAPQIRETEPDLNDNRVLYVLYLSQILALGVHVEGDSQEESKEADLRCM